MFAPQSPAPRFEGQNVKTKDVVFCERSAFPLAAPSALVAAIWDQVNEGLRAVPRGGAEVGGLLLGRHSQSGIVLAEEVVPIQIEYRFGPSFRLSDLDLNNIRSLMASVQKDPSKAVVGFYRSRTRNDSRTQESDSELLAVLEQAHTSFTTNFHYYIAFTPLSKLSMTASVSVRRDDGWDDWQHMTLRSNPMSASDPIEFEVPPKDPPPAPAPALAPALEQPPVRPPVAPLPVAHPEPHPYPSYPEPYAPVPPVRVPAHQEHRPVARPDWMAAATAAAAELPDRKGRIRALWYIGGGILLVAIGVGVYLRLNGVSQPHISFSETPVPVQAPTEVHTGFSAAREGPLWRLTWDRAAVAALNPTGAVLSIRDNGKEQQVGLTPSDLTSGTIMYTPQSGDLLFSLNIVMPGNQLAEEHVRVLGGPPSAQPPSAADLAEPVKIRVNQEVRTLRTFTPPANRTDNSAPARNNAADIPPPPSINPSGGSSLASNSPIFAAPTGAAPAPPSAAASTPPSAGPSSAGPKALRRVSPTFNGPIPAGSGSDIQVRVQIDAQGAVTKVTPVTPSSSSNFRLVQAASAAAKSWVFEPAKSDGRAVPSEMVLEFHFTDK